MTLEKIQNVLKFIEENYDRTIAVEELEEISCYSYRNLQRIFKQIFKESLGEFQKRLKLENGYKKLVFTTDTITDIAYSVGFESLQAFTKSFKKQFKISPSDAKKAKRTIFDDYINELKEEKKLSYEIVYLPPTQIFYKSIKTNNYTNHEIEDLWTTIDAIYEQASDCRYFGIIVDQSLITVAKNCRYEAAIDAKPKKDAQNFANKVIFGGKYLKFKHFGKYDFIEDTYRQIFKNCLFDSKLEFDSSPMIEFYAKHSFNAESDANFLTEILIPLKKSLY